MTESIVVAGRNLDSIQDTQSQQLILDIIRAATDIKGFDLSVLDVSRVFDLADYFVIASGRSDRHVQGIVNKISADLSEKSIKPVAIEGMDKAHWVLMDYGNVLVHVFYEQVRYLYHLEQLWINADKLDIEKHLKEFTERQAA